MQRRRLAGRGHGSDGARVVSGTTLDDDKRFVASGSPSKKKSRNWLRVNLSSTRPLLAACTGRIRQWREHVLMISIIVILVLLVYRGGDDSNSVSEGQEIPLLVGIFTPHIVTERFPLIFGLGETLEFYDLPFYGYIKIKLHSLQNVPNYEFRRYIDAHDDHEFEKYRAEMLGEYDDESVEIEYYHADELDYSPCQRPSWYMLYHPNCNVFHEVDLSRSEDDKVPNIPSFYLGHGWFRDAFYVLDQNPLIMKTTRWMHEFNHEFIEKVKRDAAVMTLLSSSPRIVNLYGSCAASVSVMPVGGGQLWDKFLPLQKYEEDEFDQYFDPNNLDDEDDVRPQNNLTVSEKIDIALAMAEGIAELHGHIGGPIVHDDMTPDQWLVDHADGSIVLGDFNRATPLLYNIEEEEYCKVNGGRGFGFYRSPEEKRDLPGDEKVDVYSLGSQIYNLLTGLRPYYQDTYDIARKKIPAGTRPFVDSRYRTRSYGEGELVRIMELCWEFHPEERIDIFEVVRQLRQVQATHIERLGSK